MEIHSHYFVTLVCLFSFVTFHGVSSTSLESDDAIVIEAHFKILEDDSVPDQKCKEGRTESTLDGTEQPVFDETTTHKESQDDVEPTTPHEAEVINELIDEPGTYPWLVEIMKDGKHFCSGSLINHGYVLTSAYCIYKITPEELLKMKVDIGFRSNYNSASRDLYDGPFMSQRVKRIIYHRRFNVSTAFNDIALLQLEHSIMFDKLVQPISIAEDEAADLENSLAGFQESIVGWKTSGDSSSTPVRDEEVITKKSLNQCRRNYVPILQPHGIPETMLCAGGDTKSTTCFWTFGSPLLTRSLDTSTGRPVQIGLFSWGVEALLPRCNYSASDPKPMVFTRISSYSEWIQRNLRH